MNNIKTASPWPLGMKWGIIGGLTVVLITYLAGLNVDWSDWESVEASKNSPVQYFSYLFMIILVVLAQLEHRNKELGGYMSYARGIGVATIVGLIAGICMALYMYVFFGIMHPEFQQMILENAMSRMEDVGPEEEAMAIKMINLTTSPGAMATFTLLGNVFVGLVCGIIVSFFTQKVNPAD